MAQYQSQAVTFGRAFANTVLAALKTVPGGALIATGKLRLSKDPSFNVSPNTLIADLTAGEADYTGYAAGGIAVVLTTGLNLTTQIQGAICTGVYEGVGGPPFTGNSITGYWIDDGTNFIMGEKFPPGFTPSISAAGDYLVLNAVIPESLIQATV